MKKIIVLSGISGSGKSTFLRALEDSGYFCMDNFPLILLKRLPEFLRLTEEKISRYAFVIDIREKEFFKEGKKVLSGIKDAYKAEFVFLESSDDILIRRFRETRRTHPLFNVPNIKEALEEERRLIGWIKELSDRVIDTSLLTIHELRKHVLRTYGHSETRMKINLMSFGYSFGLPVESDMVFDVRFLQNPFFVEELKAKTGLSDDVGEYIGSHDVYGKYYTLLLDFLLYLIPLFEEEGKSYLTLAFGCTGGKHRSVFIASQLAERFASMDYHVTVTHRDIGR